MVIGAVLAAGTLAWVRVALDLAAFRVAAGLPWARMALILGAVAAISGVGAVSLAAFWKSRDVEGRAGHDAARAAAFLATAGMLLVVRAKTPFAVLLADRFFPGWGGLEILALALYAAWLTGVWLGAKRSGVIRLRAWALFSTVFFLQLALGLSGVEHMLMTGDLHLPVPALILAGPVYRGHGFFMLTLFVSTVALAGPAWCGHLCYVGAWDGVADSRKGNKGSRLSWKFPWLMRGIVLLLVLAAALALRLAEVRWPLAVILAAAFGLAGVALMVFVSRRKGLMVHCTVWCPVGVAATLLGKLNPFRVRMAPGCTACGACAAACRYSALGPENVARGRPGLSCTLCGDCVTACPHGQMRYALPGLTPARSRAAFIVLVASLHAVFLGVARM